MMIMMIMMIIIIVKDEIERMLPKMKGKRSLSEAEKEERRAICAAIGETIAKHDISQADLMSIAGNSWRTPTVGAFLPYFLAHGGKL